MNFCNCMWPDSLYFFKITYTTIQAKSNPFNWLEADAVPELSKSFVKPMRKTIVFFSFSQLCNSLISWFYLLLAIGRVALVQIPRAKNDISRRLTFWPHFVFLPNSRWPFISRLSTAPISECQLNLTLCTERLYKSFLSLVFELAVLPPPIKMECHLEQVI